ncbi:MAG: hypothetical protein ACYC8W_05575 [Candidatus Tyrphobacter sp.]
MIERPMRPGAPVRSSSMSDVAKPCASMIGLLLVAVIVGYEWFISGLVKIVRGDFPAGLADILIKKLPDTAAWYAIFVKSVVVPNAQFFGYFIEISELLAGVVLIVGPLIWILGWDRVSDRTRYSVLAMTAAAAIGGAFLAINLHIINGGTHPWLISGGSFDEGIDLDSLLPAIQIVVATLAIILFRRLRRTRAGLMPTPMKEI